MKKILSHQEYQEFFDKLKKQIDLDWDEAKELNSKLDSIKNKNSIMIQQLIDQNEGVKELIKETPQKIEKVVKSKKEISVKDIRLDSLDNFENFFQSEFGVKELKGLGIEINIQEKTIDLTGIKSPQFLYLGKTRACASLARLYKLIGTELLEDVKLKKGETAIVGKSEAKKVFSVFFTMLGYEVITGEIKPNVRLDSLNDYMVFFESEIGLQQLKDFGAIINPKNKTFDLSNIKRPQSYRLGDLSASVAIFKIRDLLNKDDLEIERTSGAKQVFKISVAQEILKIFFEKMGYKNPNKTRKTVQKIKEEVKKVIQEPIKKSVQIKTQGQQGIKVHVDGKSGIVLTASEAKNRVYFN